MKLDCERFDTVDLVNPMESGTAYVA